MSEKAALAQESGVYHFWVAKKANKNQIKQAARKLFKSNPVWIKTMLVKGNLKTLRKNNQTIITKTKKKAMIKLPEGTKIPFLTPGAKK